MAGRPREFEEKEVLEGAMELFWEKGYELTSLGDLVAHGSIPRQSLYNVFGTKEELFRSALRHYYETRMAPNLAGMEASGADLRAIETYLDAVATLTTVPGAARVGCLVVNTLIESEDPDSLAAREAKRFHRRLERALLNALHGAAVAGQLKPGLDLRDAARFLAGAADGMIVLSRAGASRRQQRATAQLALEAIRAGTEPD